MPIASRAALALVLAAALAGCTAGIRPYEAHERAHFAGLERPSAEDIARHAFDSLEIDVPPGPVWEAALQLAVQRGVVLHSAAEGAGTRVLVFVAHPPVRDVAFYEQITVERQFYTGTTWLAVGVEPAPAGRTRVRVAWVHPETARVGPIEGYESPESAAIVAERKALAKQGLYEFLDALRLQARPPADWLRAAGDGPPAGPIFGTRVPVVTEERIDLAAQDQIGHSMSKTMRSHLYLIEAPAVTERLERVAARLALASGRGAPPFRVRIVASREPNLFSMPNGEIYVTSEVLKSIEDPAELAGLIAHEMDHYYQEDYAAALAERARVASRDYNAMVFGMGALVVGICIAYPRYCLGKKDDGEKKEGNGPAIAAIGGLVAVTAAWAVGTATDMALTVSPYSRQRELRADRNAAVYMWKSGYPPEALLRYYERRKAEP